MSPKHTRLTPIVAFFCFIFVTNVKHVSLNVCEQLASTFVYPFFPETFFILDTNSHFLLEINMINILVSEINIVGMYPSHIASPNQHTTGQPILVPASH